MALLPRAISHHFTTRGGGATSGYLARSARHFFASSGLFVAVDSSLSRSRASGIRIAGYHVAAFPLRDAKVFARLLVTLLQVERDGQVGGQPQRKCRQRLTDDQGVRPGL